MLITCLGLGEEISHLYLCGKIVEGDDPVTNRAPCEVSINSNVFGQLMLDRVSSNLKGTSTVTVKSSGRGNWDTQVL